MNEYKTYPCWVTGIGDPEGGHTWAPGGDIASYSLGTIKATKHRNYRNPEGGAISTGTIQGFLDVRILR